MFPRGYLLEISRKGLRKMLTGKGWFYSPFWDGLVEAYPYMLRTTEPLTLKASTLVNEEEYSWLEEQGLLIPD